MESLDATLGKLGDSHSCANCASSGSEGDLLEVLLLKYNIQRHHLVSFEEIHGIRINRSKKMDTNLEKSNNAAQQIRSGALGVNEDLILLVTLLGYNNLVIAIHGRAGGDCPEAERSAGRPHAQTHIQFWAWNMPASHFPSSSSCDCGEVARFVY